MKKRFITVILLAFTTTLLAACGNSESTVDTSIETTMSEETEVSHEHVYQEEVITPATCLEGGESTFICECGDSYTEATQATGHDFSNYVSNEDATYTTDGTETATCTCGEKDTRVAAGSMLTYSFEEMDVTKYAKSTVNVRSLPTSDSEKLGGLSVNDEVKITGKCNENGWYRIEYSDGIAYVSDEYLVDEKIEGQAGAAAQVDNGVFPYELFKVYDEGGVYVYYYMYDDYALDVPEERARCDREMDTILKGRYPNYEWCSPWANEVVTYGGVRYEKRYSTTLYDADRNVIVTW